MEGANEGWHEINKEGGMKAREGRRGGGWNFHLMQGNEEKYQGGQDRQTETLRIYQCKGKGDHSQKDRDS